jgi:CRP-like cAMP-binding protein
LKRSSHAGGRLYKSAHEHRAIGRGDENFTPGCFRIVQNAPLHTLLPDVSREQETKEGIPIMKRKAEPGFDPKAFLAKADGGRSIFKYQMDQVIFAQGDPADSVLYIHHGKVKVTVNSAQGKEAVVAILGPDEFCGEGCLAGQPRRMATATAMTDCELMRLEKSAMIRVLHDEPAFSEMFVAHLLARTIRVEEDLVDQLFNSSEKRLARALLLLANFGKEGKPEPIIAKVSQETLAEMIGTTRSRVSHFMNKFRDLGFIEYNGTLKVHSSLLSVGLHDHPQIRRDGRQT